MNKRTTAFFCHGCKAAGNAAQFAAMLLGVTPLQAIKDLRERYDPGFKEPEGSMASEWETFFAPAKEQEVASVNLPIPDAALAGFGALRGKGLEYMIGRGFTEEICYAWDLRWDQRSRRVAIPVHDGIARIIGFKGRAIDPHRQPKYMILGDTHRVSGYGFKPYEASRVIFGLAWVCDAEAIILCEGELNVIAMHQMGFSNTVGISGSHFSPEQAKIIRDTTRKVTLFFDSDDAGNTGVEKARDLLEPHMPVSVLPQHDGDAAGMKKEEVTLLLSGAVSSLWL